MQSGSKPGAVSRQGGGFRQGFGDFGDEHLQEKALDSTSQQHRLTQQTANAAQKTAGGSAIKSGEDSVQHQNPAEKPVKPRELGTIKEELFVLPVHDVIEEVKGFFSLHNLLQIHPGDTPEQQQKKEQALKRFNELTEEDKQEAQKKFQLAQRKKKAEEEEKQAQAQRKAAAEQQSLPEPTGKKSGAEGPNKKQRAITKLQNDRKTLGGPAGAH